MSRHGAAMLLVVVVSAGCNDWNEKRSRFDTYAQFAASTDGQRGDVPRNLVPHSARNLRFLRNIDTTEVRLEFDFDPLDERELLRPFLSFDRQLIDVVVAEGALPATTAPGPRIEVRCGDRVVEFLSITDHKRASYWTSSDPDIRASSCAKPAAPVQSGPATSAVR